MGGGCLEDVLRNDQSGAKIPRGQSVASLSSFAESCSRGPLWASRGASRIAHGVLSSPRGASRVARGALSSPRGNSRVVRGAVSSPCRVLDGRSAVGVGVCVGGRGDGGGSLEYVLPNGEQWKKISRCQSGEGGSCPESVIQKGKEWSKTPAE